MKEGRVEAAKVSELSEGEMKAVEVGDRTVVVLTVDGMSTQSMTSAPTRRALFPKAPWKVMS